MTIIKDGIKSSEFWVVSLFTIALGMVPVLQKYIIPDINVAVVQLVVQIAGGAVISYVVGRSVVKVAAVIKGEPAIDNPVEPTVPIISLCLTVCP